MFTRIGSALACHLPLWLRLRECQSTQPCLSVECDRSGAQEAYQDTVPWNCHTEPALRSSTSNKGDQLSLQLVFVSFARLTAPLVAAGKAALLGCPCRAVLLGACAVEGVMGAPRQPPSHIPRPCRSDHPL